ncbi:ClpX C4-type zinc finger protein [Paenibacillus faecalis]|uniref:ClpX C4-type zinc finger protein n=1 Tax=Paenibacillus faecalis TaxID=2079532 RepID=UPI000D10D368|nr:ClpX C4-type zinc finger protein [Paenibacillus faecalis]
MDQEFRKKTFRGAKIEDTILELEKLSQVCEEKVHSSQQVERQRFYEGMSIAYTTIALKLKGEFDYIETKVIDELYGAVENSRTMNNVPIDPVKTCSFCRKNKEEVGELAIGPGVSICSHCLKFGEDVIKSYSENHTS